MKRAGHLFVVSLVAAGLVLLAVAGCGGGGSTTTTGAAVATTTAVTAGTTTTTAADGLAGLEVTLGALIPYTGPGAVTAPMIESGVQFAVDTIGVDAGMKVTLIKEDETEDPTQGVAKARKLVEQDKVDGIVGPLLAHIAAAVGGYTGPLGIPTLPYANSSSATSPDAIYPMGPGSYSGSATAWYAFDELGAKTAAVMVMDYAFGYQLEEGFVSAFTGKGGTVSSKQRIPFGTADVAPFLEQVGDADVVAVFLLNPTDMAFVQQYKQAGLTKPVIFISCAPQEEPVLAQMGDAVLGMYGAALYGPELDNPENITFVAAFQAKYNQRPGIATHAGYVSAALYLEALKATNGDKDPAKVIQAILGFKDFKNPGGTLSMTAGRTGLNDQHVFKATKGAAGIVWSPAKTYGPSEFSQ